MIYDFPESEVLLQTMSYCDNIWFVKYAAYLYDIDYT